jgi:hypothetical protein
MGTDTTGSLVVGLVDGMGNGFGVASTEVMIVTGAPTDVLTVQNGSQVAWASDDSTYYMGLAQNGSTWVKLGSVA